MTTEIYRTTKLPGAEVSVFYSAETPNVTLSLGSVGAPSVATISAFVGPADLERLAADLQSAARAIQMPRRAA